uniref:Uncharacterized protein n=1 Tax=Sphaerodactylus townsendi TaxID=933632 RepID=A0ACB8FGA1_9SAUR
MDLKALDEFVNLPDPHYNYTLIDRMILPFHGISADYDTINMTSQKWLDKSEVDKMVWSHKLEITVPKFWSQRISISESCQLMIMTDQKDGFIADDFFTFIALKHTSVGAKSVVAVLSGALPQPLTFYNDPLRCKNITGYDIVACSWRRFMNNTIAPAHVLVQFPIVKAVVRTMDSITDYVKKEYGHDVTKFTLVGLGLSFKHHYRAYCGWSYMLRPFFEMNITQELDNPRFQELASHLDPLGKEASLQRHTEFLVKKRAVMGRRVSEGLIDIHQ